MLLFFFFSCASFTAGYFCCPRGVEGRPSCCFSPPSRSPTEPWLRQLDLHSGGSPCHPVKRLGIRVCACNLLHNTEICVFLYNLYPLLYLGYLNSRIEYFSHTHTHTQICVSSFQHNNDPASLVCSICFLALQQHRATVKPA